MMASMALSTQPYKGARDFYPEDKRVQKYVFGTLRRVVEAFGYQEYDAPLVEPIELYVGKSGEEIVAEQTYNFLDRGGRHVTLRPEMTPSVTRLVAGRRQQLSYPLRWYSLPNLWRYERPQHGRLREHYQLNVDIFGVAGIEADHEIILVADSILKTFGAKRNMYEIKINSRALMSWLLHEYLRLEHSQAASIFRLIDKRNKISEKDFETSVTSLLTEAQHQNVLLRHLTDFLKSKKLSDLPADMHQHPSVKQLEQLLELLESSGVSNAVWDPSIVRGLNYYTDIVFEVYDKNPDNNRSMFGGGRYDALLTEFGVEPLTTVGFGMGDVTLLNFLQGHKLLPNLPGEIDAVVILIGNVYKAAQKPLANMRAEGLKLAVDSTQRKLDAQIRSAAKAGTEHVIFIGEKELESQRFKLKNLTSGEEKDLSLERLVSTLASRHKKTEDL